jgi:hypothetical protein
LKLVKKWWIAGAVCDKKESNPRGMCQQKKMFKIFWNFNHKLLRYLAQEPGVLLGRVLIATRLIKFCLYKINISG